MVRQGQKYHTFMPAFVCEVPYPAPFHIIEPFDLIAEAVIVLLPQRA